MSGHVAIDSRMPSSPFGSANSKHASVYAPDSIAVWHSSPSKPVTAPPNNYDFDVEELSDNDVDYPPGAQVLYPYELEEADTPSADYGHVNSPSDIGERDNEEDTQDSDSTTFARRTRLKPASRPYAFTPLSPAQKNSRKRLRSEAIDTDTDSDGLDSSYARSEPPRLRRRTQGPDSTPMVGTPPDMNGAFVPQATTTGLSVDQMDVDEQAT
ncbi:unnamed protein product [Aureobasidium mustum]|uniref:Uncharacterized protein n=1 Tax=Aureobasidium mustum TaxID=2773714 RepID=A0A9N8PGT5_9PEZI|nr:unnamed protein product [Aureobasidium mustum]